MLAERLGGRYFDADDFHPPENVAKMAGGEPLDDRNRAPWLERLRCEVIEPAEAGAVSVLGCSALKRRYREKLVGGEDGVAVVFLDGRFEVLEERMYGRPGHYMKAGMLRSQFEILEPPEPDERVLTVAVDRPPEAVVQEVMERLCPDGGQR
ncbi:gluconokinase, GntK/IdnK-type [soil metagenome]